jgi:hypothetical protein
MLGDTEFKGHTAQVSSAVAPSATEYVPAAQLVQAALPLAILYVPSAHGEHGPPLGPV